MSAPVPIDQRLREAARSGDPCAFEQLVAPHRPDLVRFCTLMVGCPLQGVHLARDTLDHARETITAADRPDLEACSSTRVWLHRLATRACLRRLGPDDR